MTGTLSLDVKHVRAPVVVHLRWPLYLTALLLVATLCYLSALIGAAMKEPIVVRVPVPVPYIPSMWKSCEPQMKWERETFCKAQARTGRVKPL